MKKKTEKTTEEKESQNLRPINTQCARQRQRAADQPGHKPKLHDKGHTTLSNPVFGRQNKNFF